jgi:tetratricopeptide (TPR) repeat protein
VPHSSGQYCVKAQSYLDLDRLYEQGRELALAGDYDDALALLDAADQGDAMVLTMIGYSKRKSGALDEGIAYYHRALAIEPDNVNTREYLGEGYVAMGRLDLAQAELDRIGAICGEGCDQYLDLAAAMAGDETWSGPTTN